MLDHPTVEPDRENSQPTQSTAAVVLVGPPACGKSTLRLIFEDLGSRTLDLTTYHDAGALCTGWTDAVTAAHTDTVSDSGRPNVACIEGAIQESEVEHIKDLFDTVLIIRVRAGRDQRLARSVKRLETDESVLKGTDVADTRRAVLEQEAAELPYPTHDVSVRCTEDMGIAELTDRCKRIINAIACNRIK